MGTDRRSVALVFSLCVVVGCTFDYDAFELNQDPSGAGATGAAGGSGASGGTISTGGAPPVGGGGGAGGIVTTGGAGGAGGVVPGGAGGVGGSPPPGVIYGASATTVYEVTLSEPAVVAPAFDFSGCQPTDIAITEKDQMMGAAGNRLWAIGVDGTCTELVNASAKPAGFASFPQGIIDNDAEVLAGFVGNDWELINLDPNHPNLDQYEQASVTENVIDAKEGRDVALMNGKIYAILDQDGCEKNCIQEVSPKTGELLGLLYEIEEGVAFEGLASSGGLLYLFGEDGSIWAVDIAVPSHVEVAPSDAARPFTGAASPH